MLRLALAKRHTVRSRRIRVVKKLFFKKLNGPFMAVLLLVVQMHLCSPTFRFADGRECATCPTLLHPAVPESASVNSPDQHGDCHDCCSLNSCQDESHAQATLLSQSAPSFAIDIPKSVELPTEWVIETPCTIVHFIGGCPPTGPPLDTSPRGPPFFQVV